MKFLTRILLLLFVFFQFSSSIIYLIETESETKISIVFEEEENSKEESKEVKDFKTEFIYEKKFDTLLNFEEISTVDNHNYIMKESTLKSTLFLPPPEQV
jgi:hypothetical protein